MASERDFRDYVLVIGDRVVRGKGTQFRKNAFVDNEEVMGWFEDGDYFVYHVQEGDNEFFGSLRYHTMYNHILTLLLEESVDDVLDEHEGVVDLEGDEIYLMDAGVYDERIGS